METIDSLKPDNKVIVTIFGPDNSRLDQFSGEGYHNLDSAISAAISHAKLKIDPKDCVFEVTNQTKDVTHRYRLNAHDNLKLII